MVEGETSFSINFDFFFLVAVLFLTNSLLIKHYTYMSYKNFDIRFLLKYKAIFKQSYSYKFGG